MKLIIILLFTTLLFSNQPIALSQAIEILKEKNLDIHVANLEVKSAHQEEISVSGTSWGKLDFIQDYAKSNDAGNVFGFKLTSREATFGDFGFSEFNTNNPDILNVQPEDLNNPDTRNFFQSKLRYEVPLFTGFKISSYKKVMKSMIKIKNLNKEQVISKKTYELKKSFYDMALLVNSTKNLNKILQNILILEDVTKNMIDVGYAKNIDLLEVKAKKGNVERLIAQMQSNQKLLYHYISFLLNQKITNIRPPSLEVKTSNLSNEDILNSNLEIQKARYGLEVRRHLNKASEAAYYPTLGAFAEVATADDTFLGDANNHKSYTVGARLTWNIFNGGTDSANIEKSHLEYLKVQTQIALAKSAINLKIQKIKTEIKTYENDIISLKKELDLANAIYKNYEGRYKEKLSSMNDVIIKQSEQIQKILELQQARNKRNERIFALEKLANIHIQNGEVQ